MMYIIQYHPIVINARTNKSYSDLIAEDVFLKYGDHPFIVAIWKIKEKPVYGDYRWEW